jgi:hypothetical protein
MGISMPIVVPGAIAGAAHDMVSTEPIAAGTPQRGAELADHAAHRVGNDRRPLPLMRATADNMAASQAGRLISIANGDHASGVLDSSQLATRRLRRYAGTGRCNRETPCRG